MSDIKPGSGVTYTSIVNKLVQARVHAYVTTLKGMGRVAPSKKALADLEAGFRDGMRDMIAVLASMEVITMVDESVVKPIVKPHSEIALCHAQDREDLRAKAEGREPHCIAVMSDITDGVCDCTVLIPMSDCPIMKDGDK